MKKVKKVVKSQYEKKLDEMIDAIFYHFGGMTYEAIAEKSDLAQSTVWKIDMRVTRLPRLKTVFALAKVAGLDIQLVAKKVGVKVA